MAQSGWLLDSVGFARYDFVACEPGSHTIRLEMRAADDEYISFMQETGAEYVGRIIQWIYFRKHVRDGEFDIFSDLDSKIAHLNRIGNAILAIGIANLVIGLANSMNPVLNVGWINLLFATLLMYALGRIHGQKESLVKDRALHE